MISGAMRKDDPNVHVSQSRNWYNPKSDRLFFSMIVRGPFHRTDFNWKKKIWVYEVNFWKTGSFVCKT